MSGQLFTDNAFYLLSKAERILSDPAMALAEVSIHSMFVGKPTLGAYLDWWQTCESAANVNKNGEAYLVCNISGNPLTGSNDCLAMRGDGTLFTLRFHNLIDACRQFDKASKKYADMPQPEKVLTMREVLNILHAEDEATFSASRVQHVLHQQQENMKQKADRLENTISMLSKQNQELRQESITLAITCNRKDAENIYLRYKALTQNRDAALSELNERRADVASRLRSKAISREQAQEEYENINQLIGKTTRYYKSQIRRVSDDAKLLISGNNYDGNISDIAKIFNSET